jgi:putative addiction module component (TIGR02574 family)
MRKTEILEEPPKRTKTEQIRSRPAELDSEDWLDDEEPLTIHERALLDARLAAYERDQDSGSTWERLKAES